MSEIYKNINISIFFLLKKILSSLYFWTILTIFFYDISDFLCLVTLKPEIKVRSVCENECGKRFLYRIKCYFSEMHTEMLSVEELNICRDFCHVL